MEIPAAVVAPCSESDMSASVASNHSAASNLSTTASAEVDGAPVPMGGDGLKWATERQIKIEEMPQQADAHQVQVQVQRQQLPQGASGTAPICSAVAAGLKADPHASHSSSGVGHGVGEVHLTMQQKEHAQQQQQIHAMQQKNQARQWQGYFAAAAARKQLAARQNPQLYQASRVVKAVQVVKVVRVVKVEPQRMTPPAMRRFRLTRRCWYPSMPISTSGGTIHRLRYN